MTNQIGKKTGCWAIIGMIWAIGCANPTTEKFENWETKTDTATSPSLEIPEKKQDFKYDSSKQYIYLSFDDGPQRGTKETIELCRELGVKATYFMIGLHVVGRNDGFSIVKQIKNSYPQFLLANHSFTHARGGYGEFYHAYRSTLSDFQRTQDTIQPALKITRLPGNNAWALKDTLRASPLTRPITRLLDSVGYDVVGWDTEWRFEEKTAKPIQSAETMAAHIKELIDKKETFTTNQLIILMHDRMFQRPSDLDSLRKMIMILKQTPSYVFETIDHYPGLKESTIR